MNCVVNVLVNFFNAAICDFLYRLPDYRARLADYQPGDNSEIKAKLDELFADDGALVKQFHEARS